MELLQAAVATIRTSPEPINFTFKGIDTVFILERDGSLHHYPPETTPEGTDRAALPRSPEHTGQVSATSLLNQLRTIVLGWLGLNTLEIQTNDRH
jgi:hypothetical protein